jgi:multiple sugar transport system permease protein
MTREIMKSRGIKSVLRYVAIGIMMLIYIAPVYWMIVSAFKERFQVFQLPPIFYPTSLESMIFVTAEKPIWSYLINSVAVALMTTAVVILIGSIAAYAFSRYDFKRKDDLVFWIFSNRMFPPIATVIPIFLLFSSFGLIDKQWGLMLAYSTFNLAFAVWILKDFFDGIPVELDQSAALDGYSPLRIFARIVLPLAWPGIVTVSILTVIFCWNEYLIALVLTHEFAKTLPPAIAGYNPQFFVYWGPVMAIGFIITIPIAIITLVAQKWMIRGLTLGAVR